MSKKRKFVVTLYLPEGADTLHAREYVKDAVGAWKGGLHPEDPMFDLNPKRVGVKALPVEKVGEICQMCEGHEELCDDCKVDLHDDLVEALQRMYRMHDMMLEKTNVGSSFYDAKTLQEMNEAPIQTRQAMLKAKVKV